MKKRKILIILIILLTIGFASVTTTLVLNGKTNIGTNQNDFDVYFSEATLNSEENDNVTILEDRKKITFTTDKLSDVGHTSILDYKVKNNSTQYGADVLMNCTIPESDYISVEVTLDGNTIPLTNPVHINAQEIKSGRIVATMVELPTESEMSLELVCTLNVVPTEEETIVERIPEKYTEEILNGTDPVLKEGLIPVTIENDGTVKKADLNSEWYDYETKRWANAVILEDESITYNEGEVIPENNIESYFVWVPKYKYKLWNVVSTTTATNKGRHSIEIEFGTENTIEQNGVSCITPMTSGESGSCTNGEYMTHPAFISMVVNGIWVGKYETGYKGATTLAAAEVNASDASKVIIKPNVYSWRNSTVSNMFTTAYNYKQDLDSHMMKNTEWGAVAYLSHSKYGIDKEININNNSSFKTGYSGLIILDQSSFPGIYGDGASYNQPYNTKVGYLASTTGNITGIYDMSGGAHEYVASYISGNLKDSGFTTITIGNYNAKYFDIYASASDIQTYQYRILGDATGEMGPFSKYADKDGRSRYHNNWYADASYFVESAVPWFLRGGPSNHGVLAGQFLFYVHSGKAAGGLSSRLVLTSLSL